MLGPQTNLALALAQAPDIVRGLRELVLMAGAHFNGGNITPTAEFNVFADPHAAEIVLGSGVPITMLPLDLTHKVLATPEPHGCAASATRRAGSWPTSSMPTFGTTCSTTACPAGRCTTRP